METYITYLLITIMVGLVAYLNVDMDAHNALTRVYAPKPLVNECFVDECINPEILPPTVKDPRDVTVRWTGGNLDNPTIG